MRMNIKYLNDKNLYARHISCIHWFNIHAEYNHLNMVSLNLTFREYIPLHLNFLLVAKEKRENEHHKKQIFAGTNIINAKNMFFHLDMRKKFSVSIAKLPFNQIGPCITPQNKLSRSKGSEARLWLLAFRGYWVHFWNKYDN